MIVADADDFRDAIKQAMVAGDHLGRKFHGPFFAINVRARAVAHVPVLIGVEPRVEAAALDNFETTFSSSRVNEMLLQDGQVGPNDHAAVECSNGVRKLERVNQHFHSARRAATGDGECNAGSMELAYGF